MVGITGFVSKESINKSLLDRMIKSLQHQGTYHIDSYSDQHFGCARIHRGIFNPEPQPTFNKTNSLCIFFDGKIYDYQNQLETLKKKGYTFKYMNDAEFCLYSYEEYGEKFIKQLNGSFIFIIHDFPNNKTILVNDRYGHNIHFYALNNNTFFFAPEIKAILQDKNIPKVLNDRAVAEFFVVGEFWDNKTFFQNINVLPPATILTFYEQKISKETYWEFRYETDNNRSQGEYINELIQHYRKAIKIRMDDHHHGITLSGGLDSRTVLAGMDLKKRKEVITCTFGARDCDEVIVAQKVSKIADVKNHIILETSPEILIKNAMFDVWLTEGRNYIGNGFAYPLLSLTKNDIDVIFDGYALDLVLGGGYLKKEILRCKSDKELKEILSNIFLKKKIFQDIELPALFTSDYYQKIKNVLRESFEIEFNKVKHTNLCNKSDQIFINTRVTWMQIGDTPVRDIFETSHPTADNDFVDTILKIPPKWRYNHRLYRKFLMHLAPELSRVPYNHTMIRADAPLVFWRIGLYYLYIRELIKKKMFVFSKGRIFISNKRHYVNFEEWFRTNKSWQSFFRDLLLTENTSSKKYFNQSYIQQLFEEQIEGKKNNIMKLMYLATFELFNKIFFEGESQNIVFVPIDEKYHIVNDLNKI
ncbi:MAG: asparagine synthase-related protein [Candidatus Thermoplasmatota archaeon]|jgi:asparagine synthase (glutamine-hydrolysing)|nr:asparagine synthase-related protein [Candidatus Thermoplasmatota archaeon]